MEDFSKLSSKTVTEVLMLELKMSPAAKTFLISGFPRNMRDAVEYTNKVRQNTMIKFCSFSNGVDETYTLSNNLRLARRLNEYVVIEFQKIPFTIVCKTFVGLLVTDVLTPLFNVVSINYFTFFLKRYTHCFSLYADSYRCQWKT